MGRQGAEKQNDRRITKKILKIQKRMVSTTDKEFTKSTSRVAGSATPSFARFGRP